MLVARAVDEVSVIGRNCDIVSSKKFRCVVSNWKGIVMLLVARSVDVVSVIGREL